MAQRRILHDEYFKKAKAEGYLARSAYKLLEIHDRFKLLKPADWVLDLGCAPGSWMQVASEIVGVRGEGAVVGIDLSDVDPRPRGDFKGFLPNVGFIQGDAFKADPEELLALARAVDQAVKRDRKPTASAAAAGAPHAPSASSVTAAPTDASNLSLHVPQRRLFDVVLSDMAPSTSGHGDDLLSARLCRRVLEVAQKVLRPGGKLAMKVLEGAENPALLHETRMIFEDAKGFKPKSSRDVSREMFIIGEWKKR